MSRLHCANCGRPWTATDGDNGCCWNESICALAIADRRSPPAPAIDVEAAFRAIDNAIFVANVYSGAAVDVDEVVDGLKALRAALGGKEQPK